MEGLTIANPGYPALPIRRATPTPASGTPPAVASLPTHPTFQQVEQTCTEFMMQGNRAALLSYLNQLCEQGFCEWVQKFCRLRIDFGLKVEGREVVEFFQIGDTVRIHQQGQFYGKIVPLIALVDGIATVRGENWVVEPLFSGRHPASEKEEGCQNRLRNTLPPLKLHGG